jgi:hypothetical protein
MPFDSDIPTAPLVSLLHRKQTTCINNELKDVNLSSGLYPLLIKSYKNEGISQEELAETWEALREIADAQEGESLAYMLETLDGYQLPEREAGLLLELQTAAQEGNWTLIQKLVQ